MEEEGKMKRLVVLGLLLPLIFTGCMPSQEVIEPEINETQTEIPTQTAAPTQTNTPLPPTATLTPTLTLEYCNATQMVPVFLDLQTLLGSYLDLFKPVSQATTPEKFASLMKDIEELQRQLNELILPPCLEKLGLYLSQSMKDMHESCEAGIESDFDLARKKFDSALETMSKAVPELERLSKCLPNCKP